MKTYSYLVMILISIIICIPILPNASAEDTYKSYSTAAGGRVFDYDIPLIGNLSVDIEYIFDFELRKPSSLTAGQTTEIQISPTDGTLVTTFSLNGNEIPIERDINLGSIGRIKIPFTVVGEIIVLPSILVDPSITGSADVSKELIELKSMSTKRFQISVKDHFDNYDTTLKLPMTLKLDIGGNINLIVTDIDLRDIVSAPVSFEIKPTISEQIKVIKYKETYLDLQINDCSRPGYVKIKPNLKSESGKTLSNYSVSISVDGQHKTTLNSNQWSSDINVGSDSHNFQASFSESTDENDDSTIYQSSNE